MDIQKSRIDRQKKLVILGVGVALWLAGNFVWMNYHEHHNIEIERTKLETLEQLPQKPNQKTDEATQQAAAVPVVDKPLLVSATSECAQNAVGVERLNKRFPSVKREVVVAEAKQGAGRNDPMMPFSAGQQFPRYSNGKLAENSKSTPVEQVVRVPPPPTIESPQATSSPVNAPKTRPAELATSREIYVCPPLPVPEKPFLGADLKVCGMLDNKVILQLPSWVCRDYGWPATISLSPGEQFNSLSVVSVNGATVTVDEDGDSSVITLAAIK